MPDDLKTIVEHERSVRRRQNQKDRDTSLSAREIDEGENRVFRVVYLQAAKNEERKRTLFFFRGETNARPDKNNNTDEEKKEKGRKEVVRSVDRPRFANPLD